ncbi:MAG: hypothetical protein N3A68_07820 [Bacteroidia bacterium]|nr:hypothetical protein [Bacteroidia bacterium]
MARRWQFLVARPLTPPEKKLLETLLKEALGDWHTHGRPISWEVSFPYDHFIEIATSSPISGCAIDTLFRTLHTLLPQNGFALLPTDHLAILDMVNDFIFTKKYNEIIKSWQEGTWPETHYLLEPSDEGVNAVPLTKSRLAIHLCG